jgi:hypothetical protein
VERVLPSPDVKPRMGALAIGLASDCDHPEEAVARIMQEHLSGGTTLPFAGFLTPDGKWVDGFSGYRDVKAFAEVLTSVEKSPMLQTAPAVRKQLEKGAAAATAAAEHGDWKTVLAEVKKASKSSGRCPERDALRAAEKKARDWSAAELEAAVQEAGSGVDLTKPRKHLTDVKAQFAGEPEFADAETGSKAMNQLQLIREAEVRSGPMPMARDKAAATFKGTRWAAVFVPPAAAGDKPGK